MNDKFFGGWGRSWHCSLEQIRNYLTAVYTLLLQKLGEGDVVLLFLDMYAK